MRGFFPTIILGFLLLACNIQQSGAAGPDKVAYVNFYSEIVTVNYDAAMTGVNLGDEISEEVFEDFYNRMLKTDYMAALGSFFFVRKNLQLNDWFYYQLIKMFGNRVFADKNQNFRTLFSWFMLHKSGYEVQLNYKAGNPYVYLSVYTKDNVFDMPVSMVANGGKFVDITDREQLPSKIGGAGNFRSAGFTRKTAGRTFSFKISILPTLNSPEIVDKRFSFIHDNQDKSLNVSLNKSIIQLMYAYPELSISEHANIPLSPVAYASLFGELKAMTQGMSDYEAVRLLLSFTRSAMNYETDRAAYNAGNLTFTPEETLFYQFSDCEDRSVLFAYMVKELLGLDVAFVDFTNHISVAVLFGSPYGDKPIMHNGKAYTLCDPTGPSNHLKPGDFPMNVVNKPYSVIPAF